jgi:hypothetical protein
MILEFVEWLNEAISVGNTDRAADLIMGYLNKHTHHKFWRMSGVEEFQNSENHGFGLRFFYDHDSSIRFNWDKENISSAELDSIDVWEASGGKNPTWHLEFDHELSLATILPCIAQILSAPDIKAEDIIAIPDQYGMLEENSDDPFDYVLEQLQPGEVVPLTQLASKSTHYKVVQYIRAHWANLFAKDGRNTIFKGIHSDLEKIRAEKQKILHAIGAVKVSVKPGGSNETYTGDTKYDAMDKEGLERLAYEDQLKDLEGLVRLTIKGAAKALFIAGRGGIGKTHTVEKVLADAGLRDGDGYYLITGSASATGIYRELFKHRNDLVVFDDCDGALADQDSRNIIKAATDTKKVRKISWIKGGKDLLDPDVITDADIEQGKKPTYYEFKGQIVFISNLSIDKLDPDKALRTRALMISIDPTDEEVLNFMRKICGGIPLDDGNELNQDQRNEVVDLIAKNKNELNIRKLIRGLNMRASAVVAGVDNWQSMVTRYS